MRALVFLVGLIFCGAGLPAAAVHRAVPIDDPGNGSGLGYVEFLPSAYADDDQSKRPLIVFLHGLGELGDGDSNLWDKVTKHGPHKLLKNADAMEDTLFDQEGVFVCSPQGLSSDGWHKLTKLVVWLDWIVTTYPIDEDRIYLTGLSMGGESTWSWARWEPGRFAALVPVCGPKNSIQPWKVADVPIWCFHNHTDGTVARSNSDEWMGALAVQRTGRDVGPSLPADRADMPDHITGAVRGRDWYQASGVKTPAQMGARQAYTVYKKSNHDAWTATYDEEAMWHWMLAQGRQADHPWNTAVDPTITGFQAEHFNRGPAGIAWHDATPTTGGVERPETGVDGAAGMVDHTQNGEWLRYRLTSAVGGTVPLSLRLRGQGAEADAVLLLIDGVAQVPPISVGDTGGWWYRYPALIDLPAGSCTLDVVFLRDGLAFDRCDPLPEQVLVIDNDDPEVVVEGDWVSSTSTSGYYGDDYLYSNPAGAQDGHAVRYRPVLPRAGDYRVSIHYSSNPQREQAVPVRIAHASGSDTVTVDQTSGGGAWQELGTWSFAADGSAEVAITTAGTTGWIIADAVRFEAPMVPIFDSQRRVTLAVARDGTPITTEVRGRQNGSEHYHTSSLEHQVDDVLPNATLILDLDRDLPPTGSG